MEALVFSKNRPMQLELLLNSHKRFWGENITVLFKVTEPEYEEGYQKLAQEYPDVDFLPEGNFKQQVIDYVKRNKYSVFFCDDDVMIRPVTNEEILKLLTDNLACVSMRLDFRYSKHFETGSEVPVPFLIDNIWDWRKAQGDWNFPMSVLGHVFYSKDLLPLCENLIYRSPNQFESALAENPIDKSYMTSFYEARTINIPANLVQDTHPNKAGKVSVKGLNDKFLQGYRIDLDDIINKTENAKSCFMLVSYKFTKR